MRDARLVVDDVGAGTQNVWFFIEGRIATRAKKFSRRGTILCPSGETFGLN